MARKIIRYEIPVDGDIHTFGFSGPVVFVDSTKPGIIEMWIDNNDTKPTKVHTYQAFGTGEVVPDDATYTGTSTRTSDGLVWHIFELVV